MRGWAWVLLGLASCATAPGGHPGSAEPVALEEPLREQAALILSDAVAAAHPPAKTSLVVDVAGPIGEQLVARFRAMGYALGVDEGHRLAYVVEPVTDGLVHLGIALPEQGWRTDQLFQVMASGELRPLQAMAVRDDNGGRFGAAYEALPETGPPKKNDCEQVLITTGSLRSAIAREIGECGYRIGAWRFGAEGYLDDWIIQVPLEATVRYGIGGVVRLIREQYRIEGEIKPVSQTIDFRYGEGQ